MNFWEVIKKRKSIRKFNKAKDVSRKDIEKIIEAAKCAPSAGGIYPTEFIVVQDKKTKDELMQSAWGQRHVAQAPTIIVVISDLEKSASRYGKRGSNLYAIQDAAAATENLLLAVTDLGLAACWVGAFDEEEVVKILKLGSGKRPLAIIPIGWEDKTRSCLDMKL